jgi:DNA-binding NtrC family response regulator
MSDGNRAAILIVDDEYAVRDSLDRWFRRDGHRTGTAGSAEEALRMLRESSWDVILADIRMPGMDGLELQRRIHDIDPELPVVLITAFASVESAVQALKAGAFDYVTKPIDPDELSHLVTRAIERRRLRTENAGMKRRIDDMTPFQRIVGRSAPMRRVLDLVESVADTDATVLIRGDSGTGKELVAHAIHAASKRRYFPMVPVNCGALSESLLESELFGHEKGAFTGAQYRRKGRLEMADGGTLFLDEIGTISLKTQVELLRVLETKSFTRLGGSRPIEVDFRTLCATNHDLETLVREGAFREDLYYRVNVVTILIPPLRERRDDIPLLAEHFLDRYATRMNRPFETIAPDAMEALVEQDWPGNCRELANVIERALVVGKPPTIERKDLALRVDDPSANSGDRLRDVERAHVARVLADQEWNITRSATVLGIDRATLYNKIKKYDLRR